MSHELKIKPKTNRKLWIVSNYVSSSFILDVDDRIDIKNQKGVVIESISINTAMVRFYENNKVYGIITAYIWDLDTKTAEPIPEEDLPDWEDRERKRKHIKNNA